MTLAVQARYAADVKEGALDGLVQLPGTDAGGSVPGWQTCAGCSGGPEPALAGVVHKSTAVR
jgi:hypothetical protein